MSRRLIITCDICGAESDKELARSMPTSITDDIGEVIENTLDFCQDCLGKAIQVYQGMMYPKKDGVLPFVQCACGKQMAINLKRCPSCEYEIACDEAQSCISEGE